MTFEDLLKLTRRRIGTISAGVVIGLVIACVMLLVAPTTYSASAVAYVRVTVPSGDPQQSHPDSYYMASQLANQKVKAFVSVVTSEVVAEDVIASLNLDMTPAELSSRVHASNEEDQLTILVTATADSSEAARSIADEVIRQSAVQVKVLEGETSPVELVLMSPATLSATVRRPSPLRFLAVGLLGGLLFGYAGATLTTLLDKRLRSPQDVTDVVDQPVLGMIPTSEAITVLAGEHPVDYRAEEALRKLRTNLRYASIDKGLRTLVVSSALQGEGKSTLAANLARVMALAGKNVILIEGDLRRPALSGIFDISQGRPGLAQLLLGAASLDQALTRTQVPGLQVIPAGDTPPNPSELLGSSRLTELVDYLAADHVVIIDAPPILPVTDAVALAEHMDGLLLVASAGRTTSDQLRHTLSMIKQGGGTVVGIVLNRASSSDLGRVRYANEEYSEYVRSTSDYGRVVARYGRAAAEKVAAALRQAAAARRARVEHRQAEEKVQANAPGMAPPPPMRPSGPAFAPAPAPTPMAAPAPIPMPAPTGTPAPTPAAHVGTVSTPRFGPPSTAPRIAAVPSPAPPPAQESPAQEDPAPPTAVSAPAFSETARAIGTQPHRAVAGSRDPGEAPRIAAVPSPTTQAGSRSSGSSGRNTATRMSRRSSMADLSAVLDRQAAGSKPNPTSHRAADSSRVRRRG